MYEASGGVWHMPTANRRMTMPILLYARNGSKADLALGYGDVGCCLDSGHGVRTSNVMETKQSALAAKADIKRCGDEVCFGPIGVLRDEGDSVDTTVSVSFVAADSADRDRA
jgi:hypothetical protein